MRLGWYIPTPGIGLRTFITGRTKWPWIFKKYEIIYRDINGEWYRKWVYEFDLSMFDEECRLDY